MTQLLSIGRFSQLARLTPRALRLYDDLGLLRPAVVDPGTGYRLYHLRQVRTARSIRVLRELGLPLEAIRTYVASEREEDGRQVLEAHRERLQRDLTSLTDRLGRLERLLREEKVERMEYDITLKSEPARAVLSLREWVALPETQGVLKRAMNEVCALMERHGVLAAGAPWCAYPLPEEGEVVPVDCVVPVTTPVPGEGRVTFEELPAVDLAGTLHVGPYTELPGVFEAVARWVEDHSFDIVGPLREVYLEHDPGPAERHVVEVAFPVRRRP